ncbi:31731_t:CDS:2 [Gigaspora margarita]|uniref:31731_t:CDS:1 n=1 Tax=Gigaspora margarita TaxID=4874 RepID=A0ABN7V6M9_GIGMA|nr:31731_t:CDS:2 [Gigaspora margarita]
MSLINVFDDLEVFPDELSNVLVECDRNILDGVNVQNNNAKGVDDQNYDAKGMDSENNDAKGVNSQKEDAMGDNIECSKSILYALGFPYLIPQRVFNSNEFTFYLF